VDRWGKLHSALAQANIFPTSEEADFYRLQLGQPESYEIYALNPQGVPIVTGQD
jgi:hypothetical protein